MTKTGAKGKVSRQVSYDVKLFIAAKLRSRRRSMYAIRKPDAKGRYRKEVGTKENLLTLDKPLRLYIFDNVAWDGNAPDDKGRFYNLRKLMGLINVFVPLRLEVKKSIANKEVAMDRHDDVKVVFEIEDPAEELDIIEGPRPGNPRSRTGRKFVESLKNKTQLGGSGEDDNCIQAFAPVPFNSRSRRKGGKVRAPDVLWKRRKKGKYVGPLARHPSDANLAVAPVNWRRQRAGVGFHPPPVLGNNYRIKINLEKKGKYLFAEAFFTPTITIWRRVKIQLLARQKGIKFEAIKWKELKNAYHDAFIHVAGPRKKDRVVVSKREWIEYLDKYVYKTWLPTEWRKYKTQNGGKDLLNDLSSYSFPQATIDGQTLAPPDESATDPDHTSTELLKKLTERIVHKKLPKKYKGKINNVRKGARIGLCALFCHPASPGAHFGGMYLASLGPKRFYLVSLNDVTKVFAHEMGHALFLKHGATKFVREITKPMVVGSEKPGSRGPYWDQHDSEDTISCLMSYWSAFYDENGNKLSKNPTDWHFCGVCLLLLRFYSVWGMRSPLSPESFRRLNYSKKPRIAEAAELEMFGTKSLLDWAYQNSMTVKKGEKRRLLAVYEREPVKNQSGKKFWKDICHHPRGKWASSLPRKAKVNVRQQQDVWISELEALSPTDPGKPVRIEFQMWHGPGDANVIKSRPLFVTVKR